MLPRTCGNLSTQTALTLRLRPLLMVVSIVMIILFTVHILVADTQLADGLITISEKSTAHATSLFSKVDGLRKPMTSSAPVVNEDIIIYVYFESERSRKNLEFFLKHGLHGKADFLFVINGASSGIQIPTYLPNVEVLRRDNSCFDLGTHHAVYTNSTDYNADKLKRYQRFIFMNASIRGPFFPSWAQDQCWSDLYWDKLSAKVKLVGMSYFCEPGTRPIVEYGSHLQSQMLATDRTGADIIMNGLKCFHDHTDAVMEGEIEITKNIMKAGYDAYAMMGSFAARGGLTDGARGFEAECYRVEDYWNEEKSYSPYEMLFMKTWEQVYVQYPQALVDQYSEWADAMNYSSFEACQRR